MKYKTLEKRMTDAELRVFTQEIQNVKSTEKSLSHKLMGHREWLDGFNSAYQSMQRT